MPDELVTAGVFGDQTQAVAARLLLEAAGIPAFLHDELVAGGIFLWSPAVGGIKLQVPESRLEEAIKLLDERLPGEKDGTDWPNVDVGEPEEEEPEQVENPDESSTLQPVQPVNAVEEQAFAEPTLRERQADLLYRSFIFAWIFGLLLFPIMFFLWWQLIWVALSPERLSDDHRRKLRIASIGIIASTMIWLAFGFGLYLLEVS